MEAAEEAKQEALRRMQQEQLSNIQVNRQLVLFGHTNKGSWLSRHLVQFSHTDWCSHNILILHEIASVDLYFAYSVIATFTCPVG